jgi:hypothetical protein
MRPMHTALTHARNCSESGAHSERYDDDRYPMCRQVATDFAICCCVDLLLIAVPFSSRNRSR